eukprot:g1914.t1
MQIVSARQAVYLLALAAVSLRAPTALAAPLVEHFSRADGEAYVEAAARALGDAGSSLADKDYAVRLLTALDNPSVASGYKSSACSAAAAGLSSGDLEQIHHAISLGNGVGGCSNAKTWRASEEVAEAMKRVDLRSLYHATLAAPLLGADVSQGASVLEKVLDLLESDGSVRSYPDGPVEPGNAFMAAELLAALVPSAKGDAKTIALRKVDTMKEKVLAQEPALLVLLNRAAGSMLNIKATKLKSMARNLMEASRTTLPKSMLGVYETLKAIEGYPKAPLPIKLLPASPSVEELSSGGVSLLITSLLGSPAKVKSASLTSLARADGSEALGSGDGSPLGAPGADGFRALPAVEVAAGVYTAGFSVEIQGGDKALVAKLPLAVGSAAALTQARVSVSESKERPSSFASATAATAMSIETHVLERPGETLLPPDARASAVDGHHLHVELSLRGVAAAAAAAAGGPAPHQVFVRFMHAETGLETFFVAAPVDGGGAGEFSVSVSLAEESQTFLQRSGAYELTALIGGPLVMPPVSRRLGVIGLLFPDAKERKWPIYARPLLHETDVSLGPLPEKHHTFREPEVRPHAGVSLLFTALALAPLAGLALGMRRGGANLRRLPAAGAGRAWCAAYQACMVGAVVLFATYWVALTMAYTLKVLAVLSVVTTFTGRMALQSLAVETEGGRGGERSGVHDNCCCWWNLFLAEWLVRN